MIENSNEAELIPEENTINNPAEKCNEQASACRKKELAERMVRKPIYLQPFKIELCLVMLRHLSSQPAQPMDGLFRSVVILNPPALKHALDIRRKDLLLQGFRNTLSLEVPSRSPL